MLLTLPFIRALCSSKAQTPDSFKMTLFLLEKNIINKVKVVMFSAEAQSLLRLLSQQCSFTFFFSFLFPYLRSHIRDPIDPSNAFPRCEVSHKHPQKGFLAVSIPLHTLYTIK